MSDLFWNCAFLVLTKCLYKGPVVQRPPRSFLLSCFSGSQQDLFSFGCICLHCFSWPLCPLPARNDLLVPHFSVCPLLCCCVQGRVWKVSIVHPARYSVSSEGLMLCAGGTNLEVFMKAPQIAITSSEIHK